MDDLGGTKNGKKSNKNEQNRLKSSTNHNKKDSRGSFSSKQTKARGTGSSRPYISKRHYSKQDLTKEDIAALEQFMLRKTNTCEIFGLVPFIRIKSAIENNNFKQASFSSEWLPLDDELLAIAFTDGGSHLNELYTEPYIAFIKLKALGRQVYSQKKRAIQLGYLSEDEKIIKKSALWSNYELEILHRDFPVNGVNIPELLKLGRTRNSIESKARKEGLIKE